LELKDMAFEVKELTGTCKEIENLCKESAGNFVARIKGDWGDGEEGPE